MVSWLKNAALDGKICMGLQWIEQLLDGKLPFNTISQEKSILAAPITMEEVWSIRNEKLTGLSELQVPRGYCEFSTNSENMIKLGAPRSRPLLNLLFSDKSIYSWIMLS